MKYREMGSEFWDAPISNIENNILTKDSLFVLSGRTALNLVARDIIQERKCRSICLPAYCCESMIDPFVKEGLELKYYDVIPSKTGIRRILPEKHDYDIILLLDYFGFSQTETVEIARQEHDCGIAVIVDQVQSFFSESDALQFADYTVMSWRKWFFSCAAAARKCFGEWKVQQPQKINSQYVALRKEAAKRKEDYLKNGAGKKEIFLEKYADAETLLNDDFSDYSADLESLNNLQHLHINFLKEQRQKNADVIYEALSTIDDDRIHPLFPQIRESDVPLFVPVLVNPSVRGELRKFLIHNHVYCPIHWADGKTGGGEALYSSELSLLCDQRYTSVEIEWEMSLIKEFLAQHA